MTVTTAPSTLDSATTGDMIDTVSAAPDTENVKVVVRVRPLNKKELSADYRHIVHVDSIHGTVKLDQVNGPDRTRDAPPKVFTFDTVFGPDSTQMDVYNRVARSIVDNVLQGYNGTIFAYGQTGTGKTFTMEGDRRVPELKGIIPNSFAHIFGHIFRKADSDLAFLVRVSYLEIYNEDVRDLLGKDQNLRLEVKERPDIGVYVKDLSVFMVNNADDMDKLMTMGNRNRSIGATNMNALSSRSHAIFSITVECSEKTVGGAEKQRFRVGKLHLVDLAGSERQSKTGATGKRLKEATKINLSLSTLGNVISALVDGKSSHVPYRNSKLTRLLQDSLGGNSKTLMFANIGPAEYNYDESLSTLRYASRAKNIKNHAKVNEDPKDTLMKKYQEEIEELRRMLEQEGDEEEEEEEESDSGDDNDDSDSGDVVVGENKTDKNTSPQKQKTETSSQKSSPTKSNSRSPSKPPSTHEQSNGPTTASRKVTSQAQLEEMKLHIEEERKRLKEEKNMKEEERKKVYEEVMKQEKELSSAQAEHNAVKAKLAALERKIIVGGENLLEKAEEQEKLLDESAHQLEDTISREASIRKALKEKEAERLDIEEKYSSLQEEASGKTRKLKKVWSMLTTAKAELADVQAEQQQEMEGLLDNVRQLTRDLRLQMLIIDAFIPPEYQAITEENVQWNEEIGEWQLKCVAYTGNNMRKRSDLIGDGKESGSSMDVDMSHVYLHYPNENEPSVVSNSGAGAVGVNHSTSNRPRTARSKGGGRPKSSRPRSKR